MFSHLTLVTFDLECKKLFYFISIFCGASVSCLVLLLYFRSILPFANLPFLPTYSTFIMYTQIKTFRTRVQNHLVFGSELLK